jgi:hypothetical protein
VRRLLLDRLGISVGTQILGQVGELGVGRIEGVSARVVDGNGEVDGAIEVREKPRTPLDTQTRHWGLS